MSDPTIPFNRADLWPMLVSAIRYALPRRSGITMDARDWLERYGAHLGTWHRAQIAREIREHLDTMRPAEPELSAWRSILADLDAGRMGEMT